MYSISKLASEIIEWSVVFNLVNSISASLIYEISFFIALIQSIRHSHQVSHIMAY